MGKKEITTKNVIEATISYVAENGLENLSVKKVAMELGLSEGTIFHYYPTKRDLLLECLYSIDQEIDKVLKDVPFSILHPKEYARNMWFAYFNYLCDNGSKANYYRRFRVSSYYDAECIEGQNQSFSFFSSFLCKHLFLDEMDADVFWVYIIGTTLNFAVRISNGTIKDTPKIRDNMFDMMWNGVDGIASKVNILK